MFDSPEKLAAMIFLLTPILLGIGAAFWNRNSNSNPATGKNYISLGIAVSLVLLLTVGILFYYIYNALSIFVLI